MRKSVRVSFCIGEGVAVIRREGSTTPIVANILGREVGDQNETIYMDRLVHSAFEDWQDWTVDGAISTILTRKLTGSAPISTAKITSP